MVRFPLPCFVGRLRLKGFPCESRLPPSSLQPAKYFIMRYFGKSAEEWKLIYA